MSETPYDVVVVGGGTIAAAAGQHLAAAGYRTLLAERGDYGGGTSSRTSRLQHCGLSYFSPAANSIAAFVLNPKFGLRCIELARRAMRGRSEFVQSSPERVRKLDFIVPLTPENAVPAWRARLAFRLMAAFDGGKVPLSPRFLSAVEARKLPALQGLSGLDRIRGAICFDEYQFIWPERLIMDTIVKAREIGLEAHNYTPVSGLERDGEFWSVTLGGLGHGRKVSARAVVNCAGVWVDEVTGLAGPDGPLLNSGAKGTNIVARLPEHLRGYGLETVTSTGMAFYLIPWGDLHYIGPWDTPATGAPENFRATEEEIQSILREWNMLFPKIRLDRGDVLYSWAGARPRTRSDNALMGGPRTREHDLSDRGMPNYFAFTGGLLMTHRDAGRRLTRAVARRLAPSGPKREIDYGARLVPEGDRVSETSVLWTIEKEQARTLAGILRRRLPVGWEEDLGLGVVEEAARIAAGPLGWSAEETARQIERYRADTALEFAPRSGVAAASAA
ncbi:MAG: FAD-dependent oxidoreductase [Pikeienuella sp.]